MLTGLNMKSRSLDFYRLTSVRLWSSCDAAAPPSGPTDPQRLDLQPDEHRPSEGAGHLFYNVKTLRNIKRLLTARQVWPGDVLFKSSLSCFSRMLQLFHCEAPELFCGPQLFTWLSFLVTVNRGLIWTEPENTGDKPELFWWLWLSLTMR